MSYYVYIMSNYRHTLYIGVTNDLERRVAQHKIKLATTRIASLPAITLINWCIAKKQRILTLRYGAKSR